MTTTELYKPSLAVDLSTEAEKQIRLGIQGEPGTGKTTSALTFPNPVIVNWDRGLRAFQGRADIIQFPMYDNDWIQSKLGIIPNKANGHKLPSIPDACKKLLTSEECKKLTINQTLIWDSWTRHQDYDDKWNWEVPYYTKQGVEDERKAWMEKQDHALDVLTYLAELRCNVVVIFHTSKQRDPATGKLLEKIQPLMQGGFQPKLKGYFPFFFNQVVKDGQYLWQTKSDASFDSKCCCPQDSKIPAFIPANYNELVKYLTL